MGLLYAFKLLLANVPILYPLKTSENLWFSGVFRWCKMKTLAKNGLTHPVLISPILSQNTRKFWNTVRH